MDIKDQGHIYDLCLLYMDSVLLKGRTQSGKKSCKAYLPAPLSRWISPRTPAPLFFSTLSQIKYKLNFSMALFSWYFFGLFYIVLLIYWLFLIIKLFWVLLVILGIRHNILFWKHSTLEIIIIIVKKI